MSVHRQRSRVPSFASWLHRAAAFSAAAALAGVAARTMADGVFSDGFSAKSGGRGGTNIAHSDNGAVLLENPAGLVNFQSSRFVSFDQALVIGDLKYSDPQNAGAQMQFHFPENVSPLTGITYMQKSGDGQWAYGLGVYTPAGFGTAYDLNTTFAGNQNYRSLDVLTRILPAASYRVSDRLAIGGSFGVAVNHAELEGPLFVQTGPLAGAPMLADVQATDAAPTWTVGLQYQLGERTTFGLAYTEAIHFSNQDGEASLDVFGLGPGPVHANFDFDLDLTYPQFLAGGIKHNICDHQSVSVDVIWFDWSSSFDHIDVEFSHPNNPAFPAVLRDTLPLDWHDTVSVRLGYEYQLSECETVRAGYVHRPSPIPSRTFTTYIPPVFEHDLTIGYSRDFGDWKLDLSYIFLFGSDLKVGNSALVGDDFSNSKLEEQYHVIFVGLSREF